MTTGEYTNDIEVYIAYKKFYSQELMKLFVYKPIQKERGERAYAMEDVKIYVQGEMLEMADHYNELASAYHTAQSKANDIPCTIDTGTRDTSGLTDSKHTALELKVAEQNTKLDDQASKIDSLMTLVKNQNQRNTNTQGRGQGRYPYTPRWRQLNRYCWTHGVCTHTSERCKSGARGHKSEATFQNKMGGSTKGASDWNKWLCPNNVLHDTKGTE